MPRHGPLKNNCPQVGVRLIPAQMNTLDELAAETQLTRTELARRAITAYLTERADHEQRPQAA